MNEIRIGEARRPEDDPAPDVIVELSHQQARIFQLIGEVRRSKGAERLATFAELREFLIMHETAEQMVVRPVVAAILGHQDSPEPAREVERTQDILDDACRSPDGEEDMSFLIRFAVLESEVGARAARETGDEWSALAYGCSAQQRERMGRQLRAASASVRGRRALSDASNVVELLPQPESLTLIVERTYHAINSAA